MSTKVSQQPLILHYHRLMEAFAKADDERDYYLDKKEGFIVYIDLDKNQEEIDKLEKELIKNSDRYFLIPKLTFYETKKIMEGFVNEKVFDIDTKEKLLDIIQSRDAREAFLEFIYDHIAELEKWQQYYQERSRVRIIEWLRNNDFYFVFEEDLDLPPVVIERLKESFFDKKASRDIVKGRSFLEAKAKTYYSNEALNPRPKRGRPPKQTAKVEVERKMTNDIYSTVPAAVRPFLFIPEISNASSVTFSSKYDNEEAFLANLRSGGVKTEASELEALTKKLDSLRSLSRFYDKGEEKKKDVKKDQEIEISFDEYDEDDDEEEVVVKPVKKAAPKKSPVAKKAPPKKAAATKAVAKKAPPKKAAATKAVAKKAPPKKAAPTKAVAKKALPKKAVAKKAPPKNAAATKAVAKKAPPKKAVAKKAPPKKAAATKAVAKKGKKK
jgi:hypothetical protein